MDSTIAPLDTLADRLRAFRFEEPGAPPFTDKLARENGWRPLFAQRVVEEYRRFLWIAAASTELVSPSEAVDRAWHLHLLDTRSYWERLCPQVLGRPLHHQPGRGGLIERRGLEEAYARTLASYRAAFGEPPEDIWPAPHRRRLVARGTIDRTRDVAIPRRFLSAAGGALALGLGAATSPIWLEAWRLGTSLAELPFLLLLGVGAGANVLAGLTLRRRAARAPISDCDDQALDRYEVAYLAEGARGATHVAVTELVCARALAVDAGNGRLVARTRWRGSLTPLQQLVMAHVLAHPKRSLQDQLPPPDRVRALIEPGLVAGGLVIPRVPALLARMVPSLGMLGVGALAVIRVVAGAPMAWPWLTLPILLGAGVALAACPLERTGLGDAVLGRRRAAFQLPAAGSSEGDDFATLVALFGATALHSSTLVELGELLSPTPSDGSGSACGGCGG